ncbi:MAG TPA: response regulator [Nevskiaceae bacterium]|nr:response regulator [Nevskiaceae bacterium]
MDASATRIAVVDDEAVSREAVVVYLKSLGFDVISLDGAKALRASMAHQRPPELVVLDLVMPGEDGLSALRWLRSTSDVPVIMLTSNAETTDRVVGLELGADDYVAKPADMRELLARIRTVLRRKPKPTTAAPAPKKHEGEWFGRWRLDRARRGLIDLDGTPLQLTAAEYALLAVFADHPNVVLSREKLLELSGAEPGETFDRAIDIRITRLRRKIEPVPGDPTVIKTIRGHGGGYEYVPSEGPRYGR